MPAEKICKLCRKLKPLSEFHVYSVAKDLKQDRCKVCACRVARDYYYRNKAKSAANMARWRKENPERNRVYKRRWNKLNRDTKNADTQRRRAQKSRATPSWATKFFMDEIRRLAVLRTKALSFKWEVDHIVPLRSPIVCGLHVETNLRVVPAAVNSVKGNLTWPDMP